MKNTTKLISLMALTATIVPSVLFVSQAVGHNTVKLVSLLGTIAWFVATPLWMGRNLPLDASEVEI